MNFYLKMKLVFFALVSICFLSCSENETLKDNNDLLKNQNNDLSEAISFMQDKGIINSATVNRDDVTIIYPDNSQFTFDISNMQQIEVYDSRSTQFVNVYFDQDGDDYNLNHVLPFFNPDHEG